MRVSEQGLHSVEIVTGWFASPIRSPAAALAATPVPIVLVPPIIVFQTTKLCYPESSTRV